MLTKPDIDWLKDEFLPALADAVEKRLHTKLDDIGKKLDGFVGDIQDKRETQELHSQKHSDINETLDDMKKRLENLEKRPQAIP